MGPVERQHENEASTVGPDVFVVRSLRDFWQLPETGRSRIDAQCVQNQLPCRSQNLRLFPVATFQTCSPSKNGIVVIGNRGQH